MGSPKIKNFEFIAGKKYDGMMGRCYRKTDKSYSHYGGRGIRVHRDWIMNLDVFRTWLRAEVRRVGITEEAFITNAKKWQLDRIDVNGHYEPTNCRLCSAQTNSRNRRNGVLEYEASDGIVVKAG